MATQTLTAGGYDDYGDDDHDDDDDYHDHDDYDDDDGFVRAVAVAGAVQPDLSPLC